MSRARLRRCDPAKERYWRGVVQGQGGSGQSVREYCRQAGVKESAFYWWRRRLARRSETREAARSESVRGRKALRSSAAKGSDRSGASSQRRRPGPGKPATTTFGGQSPGKEAASFVPIRLMADNSAAKAAVIEIHLGDGRMVRVGPGIDRQTLVEVLRAMEDRSC